ncbi:MAG: PAS domain S-box protein [Nitrospirota bacterium]
MFKTRIIYRLIFIFLLFAVMIVVPLTITIVKQVNTMIVEEEKMYPPGAEEYTTAHRELPSKLVENIIPYAFYILVLALMMSVFFMRKMLFSLKELRKGSQEMKNGNLDINLEIASEDELGDVTRAFNEMAVSLREKTLELSKKDTYVNAMLDPLWVVDEDNNIVDINPAFTRLFGHRREDVIGASIYDFFDEKNAAIMRNQLEEKRQKGIASIYEINIFAKDGSQIPVLISGSPIYSGDRIVGKIGILKDFREQSELRNALQQSRDYLETIMDSIEDEIVVIDRDYRIVKANKIAKMNAGGPIIGEYCHDLFHDLSRPCWTEGHECPAQTVFITGRYFRITHKHTAKSGEIKYYEIVASPVRDSSGNILNVIELKRDVTEKIKREEEIFRKNRELVSINSIAGLLSRSLRADEIFTKVLDKMIEMMNMDGGGIFFIDDANKEMTCHFHRGISDEYVRMLGRIRLGEDIPGKVAVTGQIMTTSDLSKDHRVERSVIKHSGIRAYCCIPIRGKERIIGVFCLFSLRTHFFTPEEENILNTIGEMTGIALENIRLYQKMRDLYEYQRKRREDEHSQLLSLSAGLGSTIELKGVMGNVIKLLKDFFSADFVWLLINDDDGNLILKSATSFIEMEDRVIYQKGISSIETYAIEKKSPEIIRNIKAQEKFYISPEISGMSYQTAISVPMYIGEKPVGAFTLYYIGRKDFKEEEIHFLEIISNMLVVSIERYELYIKTIMEKGLSEAVLQSVTDGIITIDNYGRVISINRAFEKIADMSSADAVGLPLCDIFRYSDKNDNFRFLLGECIETALSGSSASREGDMVTVYGDNMAVNISSAPVLDENGKVIGAVNLLRDVSREKEIDRMKTELIRSVSHEFRTPLSAIVGMTEMIINEDIEEGRVKKYLDTILSEGIRLTNMVSDLLCIARIESGKESLRIRNIDINALLSDIRESLSALIEKKKAVLKFEVNDNGKFTGDEEKIKQLLLNFLDNSLTFSDEGCLIEIKVVRKGDDLEIKISDNGWGIPEEDMPHLTERFYRGKHGEKIKGTGLGLSLCNEIVKMHGGKMEIKSRLGHGTEIIVTVPYRGAE